MVFSPEGRHMKDTVFSARNMACTTWGGQNQNILFIATGKDRKPTAKIDDEGGHMFRYHAALGIKGTSKYEFAG
jgi:sugar lactone lactonase YvrE